MKRSLDTTVLIAGLHRGHKMHEAAIPWLENAAKSPENYAVCQHGLAEAYSVLTNAPASIRVTPLVASQLIHDLKLAIVPIDPEDYKEAITRLAAGGLPGGIIYDMLHAIAAEKFGAEQLVTANESDFVRLPLNRVIKIVALSI
ncbi:MAG: PIN domain-containing protein [Armatimonadota bacterium]|nr:PIN domain-containing protein [Armatimonadota bacterium]